MNDQMLDMRCLSNVIRRNPRSGWSANTDGNYERLIGNGLKLLVKRTPSGLMWNAFVIRRQTNEVVTEASASTRRKSAIRVLSAALLLNDKVKSKN